MLAMSSFCRERPSLNASIELEEGPVRLRHELPHALELGIDVNAVEFHGCLLVSLPCARLATVFSCPSSGSNTSSRVLSRQAVFNCDFGVAPGCVRRSTQGRSSPRRRERLSRDYRDEFFYQYVGDEIVITWTGGDDDPRLVRAIQHRGDPATS